MNIYTVSFFGHREIDNPHKFEDKLEKIIHTLIKQKDYIDFLVGRDGEFDLFISSTIKRITYKYGYGNNSLVLVLPYLRAEYVNNRKNFLDYYDEVEIRHESAKAHFKSAIQIRNRCMVDRSDLIICCVQKNSGGAYKTVKYAENQQKNIINVSLDEL